jgi:hypothetical protein
VLSARCVDCAGDLVILGARCGGGRDSRLSARLSALAPDIAMRQIKKNWQRFILGSLLAEQASHRALSDARDRNRGRLQKNHHLPRECVRSSAMLIETISNCRARHDDLASA